MLFAKLSWSNTWNALRNLNVYLHLSALQLRTGFLLARPFRLSALDQKSTMVVQLFRVGVLAITQRPSTYKSDPSLSLLRANRMPTHLKGRSLHWNKETEQLRAPKIKTKILARTYYIISGYRCIGLKSRPSSYVVPPFKFFSMVILVMLLVCVYVSRK